MNKILSRFGLLVLTASIAMSCVTQKQMTYLANAGAEMSDSVNATFVPRAETVLRVGDAVTVFITALDNEAVAPYNLPTTVFAVPGSSQVQTTPMLQYYIVDKDGAIELPVLGKVAVSGLTRTEAEEHIKEILEKQVLNPLVHIQLVNAKVSVIGEVNRPGNVSITGDRMTIFDALAAAGDLTTYGRRDNVLITREVNGKLEMARVNLRNTDLFSSPYYYLQQNDVVYVSPNKVRAVSSANTGIWLSIISTALSAATVIVTVVK